MKILIVYPPFCTPATPPYSLANIYTFLKNNLNEKDKVEILDLNLEFHKQKYSNQLKFYKEFKNLKEYEVITKEFLAETKKTYSENNNKVVRGEKPELLDYMVKQIISKKPDVVAISVIFSSQTFYANALIDELKKYDIKIVVGGPSINKKLGSKATKLNNELELLNFIIGREKEHDKIILNEYIDFSKFDLQNYFTKKPVIPLKTSSSCYYRTCAFCTHHQGECYYEYPIKLIEGTVKKSKQKYFFFVDDMIHKNRLLELSKVLKPLKVSWTCQLRPTKELDKETLKILYESGLKTVTWGVESGNDRVLKKIRKGTNTKDIAQVLKDSHNVGIKNGVYIMFGFPTETKEEFLDTINFITENDENIDIILTSIFGLQKGTIIYERPDLFSITKINEKKRTILEPQISYEISLGLSNQEAKKLRQRYKKTIEKINKYPKSMNFFREHMLNLL